MTHDSDAVPISDPAEDDIAERVTAVARDSWPGAVVDDVRRLEGGVSSLTYAARLAVPGERPREIVLKVAPPGLEPVRNRDVLRQARVLDRLVGLDGFPVPAVLIRDAGSPTEVPPLFAMELRRGQAYEPMLDVSDQPPSAKEVLARERSLTRALAMLHSRTPAQLGVGDEPTTSAHEELTRWSRLLGTVDPDIAPGHEELAARLEARVPKDIAPRLVHGDYRAANMLFVGEHLEAVIDWEIWSVGDPRPDLAWVLMHTAPSHVFHLDRSPGDIEAGRLMPSAADLLEVYADAWRAQGSSESSLEESLRDLHWFLAVGHYKVLSTIAVIWKRERRRPEPDPKLVVAAERLDPVLDAGHAALDQLDV